jgi:hypothetical protein
VECDVPTIGPRLPDRLWVYAYLIVPPFAGHLLITLRLLMQREHVRARVEGRTWSGRLVLERLITQVLVVSDSPGQDLGINDEIVAELRRIKANFVTTSSLELPRDDDPLGPFGTPVLMH